MTTGPVDAESRPEASQWGIDSEYGVLRDVLVCPPHHYRWLPTSPISQATLDSGRAYDPALAARQHAELVSVYGQAGVRCHFLEPDPALPYQVFARDSSAMTPWGAVVTQPQQWWRRGEYGPVIRFYQGAGIPIFGMISAAALEGGDVIVMEPGRVLIGCGEARTQEPAAAQLAGWFEQQGWEARVEFFPGRYVHLDVLVSVVAEKLAAVCLEVISGSLAAWLRGAGFELIEVPEEQAFLLGVNAMALGDGRVLSSSGATVLNDGLRAHGLDVLTPDLEMFTLGGGGAHCLGQALRRERIAA
jgi:N-dimethylarginine dimethylaminohydrolase